MPLYSLLLYSCTKILNTGETESDTNTNSQIHKSLPLLTPPLCTVGRFVKIKLFVFWTQHISSKTFHFKTFQNQKNCPILSTKNITYGRPLNLWRVRIVAHQPIKNNIATATATVTVKATATATATGTPTATATYPPPANSPTMQSKLVCQNRNFWSGEPAYLVQNTKSWVHQLFEYLKIFLNIPHK